MITLLETLGEIVENSKLTQPTKYSPKLSCKNKTKKKKLPHSIHSIGLCIVYIEEAQEAP